MITNYLTNSQPIHWPRPVQALDSIKKNSLKNYQSFNIYQLNFNNYWYTFNFIIPNSSNYILYFTCHQIKNTNLNSSHNLANKSHTIFTINPIANINFKSRLISYQLNYKHLQKKNNPNQI